MTLEQVKKLSLVVRQVRDVVKSSIDEISDIAESALSIFIDSDQSNTNLTSISNSNEKRLLNKKEIANKLGISVRTLCDLQNEGLPTVKLGKRVLFDYEEVLNWAKRKEIKSRRKNKFRVVR